MQAIGTAGAAGKRPGCGVPTNGFRRAAVVAFVRMHRRPPSHRLCGGNLSGSPVVEHSAHVHAFDHAFAHFRFDGQRQELRRDGAPVALEPRAIAVLQDLLLHAGELRSREALLDAVWGHRHVTPDVLNRCIAQLRRALDDPAGQPHFIQTVHRLGYRFVGDVRLESWGADEGKADGSHPRGSDLDGAAGAEGRRGVD